MDEKKIAYKRVLLKLAGEALSGDAGTGLDFKVMAEVCGVVAQCATVSYTHLAQRRCRLCRHCGGDPRVRGAAAAHKGPAAGVLRPRGLCNGRSFVGASFGVRRAAVLSERRGAVAVSYTHLAVYKRQKRTSAAGIFSGTASTPGRF